MVAKYATKTLSWIPSPDVDVVAHKVYVATGAVQPDYNSPFIEVPAGQNSVELPFINMPEFDGTFNFGLSAVDDFGNESDLAHISMDLDFLAPSPPTGLSIT
jgi:hypothetical protein